jgi:4-hydroxy-3-polyprenylbenzoate decarboxylase
MRLLDAMLQTKHQVKVVISPAGEKVLAIECDVLLEGTLNEKQRQFRHALNTDAADGALEFFDHKDLAAPISSGSFPTEGMVIVPCSMGTVGRIANGVSSDLISRAADVMIKERRRLIVVPRETPLSEIHLRNMLTLRRAGAEVLPAMPAFYHRPETIDDLVDMVVSRILDRLGIENHLFKRWKGEDISRVLDIEDD